MIRISFGLLYVASLILFKLVSTAQTGSSVFDGFFMVTVLLTASEAAIWAARQSFAGLPKLFKVIYAAWTAAVIVALLVSWNLHVEHWPVRFPAVSQIVKISFWPGVVVSTLLFGMLLTGSRNKNP